MTMKTAGFIAMILQTVGILLAAPGLWIERWGVILERKVERCR